ncbi:MAG: hypothetical protein KIT43_09140 [Bauldia sp.]|nr:hypothetical protein [Bauldia sp.]
MNAIRLGLGAFVALIGIGLLVAGVGIATVASGGDEAGFHVSPEYTMRTSAVAIASGRVDLAPSPADWLPAGTAAVRLSVRSLDGQPVFVGIGPANLVEGYLRDVAHDEVTGLGERAAEVTLRSIPGGAARPPALETFWDIGATTGDSQTLTWDVKRGAWSLVIMNAQGNPGVAVAASFGVRVPGLLWIGIGIAVAGLLLGLGSVLLLRRAP